MGNSNHVPVFTRLFLFSFMFYYCFAVFREGDIFGDDPKFSCPAGWTLVEGSCYSFHKAVDNPSIKNIRDAAVSCVLQNATLAHVRSYGEMIYLSSHIEETYSDLDTWYIGGKKKRGGWYWVTLVRTNFKPRKTPAKSDPKIRRRFIARSKSISQVLWYPGALKLSDGPPEPVSDGRMRCLTLSKWFRSAYGEWIHTNTHFWKVNWCNRRSGLNFICQRDAVPFPGVCGRTRRHRLEKYGIKVSDRMLFKIRQGKSVPYGQHPWQVATKLRSKFKTARNDLLQSLLLHRAPKLKYIWKRHCSATIINQYWLLSAAHCFFDRTAMNNRSPGDIRVVVGDDVVKKRDPAEQVYDVEKIVMHPYFTNGSNTVSKYDLALLKVKPLNGKGIVFNGYVQPACLPTADMPPVQGQVCTAAGWGTVNASHGGSERLLETRIPVLSHKLCRSLNAAPNARTQLCAGDLTTGAGGARGDSGGPLMCEYQEAQTVTGVISYGFKCETSPKSQTKCEKHYPTIFTRVQTFVPWIQEAMRTHSSTEAEMALPVRPQHPAALILNGDNLK